MQVSGITQDEVEVIRLGRAAQRASILAVGMGKPEPCADLHGPQTPIAPGAGGPARSRAADRQLPGYDAPGTPSGSPSVSAFTIVVDSGSMKPKTTNENSER